MGKHHLHDQVRSLTATTIEQAAEKRRLGTEVGRLRQELARTTEIIGEQEAEIERLKAAIRDTTTTLDALRDEKAATESFEDATPEPPLVGTYMATTGEEVLTGSDTYYGDTFGAFADEICTDLTDADEVTA